MKKYLERLLQKILNMGLQTKLLIFTLLLSVLPLVLLGVLSFETSRTVLRGVSDTGVNIILEEKKRFIRTVMEEVESLIANVSGQDALKQVLSRSFDVMSDYDKLSTQARIGYILSGYINLKGLVSIDVFTPGGNAFHVGDTLDVNKTRGELVELLYAQAGLHPESVFWSGLEDNINASSSYEKVVTAVKRIPSRNDEFSRGTLIVVSYDPVIMNQGNIVGASDYFILVDSQNRVVAHPDVSTWGQPLREDILRGVRTGQGNFQVREAGGTYEVHSQPLEKGDWTLLHFSSQEGLNSATRGIATGTLASLVLALLLVLFLSRLVTQQIVRPIKSITLGFRTIQIDDSLIPDHLPIRTQDEIGTLIHWYNDFLDSFTEKKRTQEELRLKQEELKELNRTLEERIEAEVSASRDKDGMLIQQSRQASMGEMIGNIAHQWRQPLNTVALLVQDMSMDFEDGALSPEGMKEFVTQVLGVISNMSTTIDDFRDFFKPNKSKTDFSVELAVNTTISFLDSALKNHSITLRLEKSNPGFVHGYPNEFSQVLLNILNNAKDILVEKNPAEKVILIRLGSEGGKQFVTIADSGGGVPEGIREKIFDPYFTTKGPSVGTGIGLFMSRTIIERNMGGKITVRNTAFGEGLYGAEFCLEI